jgi:hypothetical protein
MDLLAFAHHLRTCRCPRPKGGRRNHHTVYGARRYHEYLVAIDVGQSSSTPESQKTDPAIIIEYGRWLRRHRGAAETTVRLYSKDAGALLAALGDDPGRWDAKGVRDYFLDRPSKCGAGTAERVTTGLRAFLRYLSATGRCQAGLDQAVPAFASWRLARLPRYLTAEQVTSLIAACDGSSLARRRDRAIILSWRVSDFELATSRGFGSRISSGRPAHCGSPGRAATKFDCLSHRTLETRSWTISRAGLLPEIATMFSFETLLRTGRSGEAMAYPPL